MSSPQEQENREQSLLDITLDGVAQELAANGSATREFAPDEVKELAEAAIAERGKSDTVKDVSISIGQKKDEQPLMHVALTNKGRHLEADLENVQSDRRGQEEDPTSDRIQVKGLAQRGLAKVALHGDINDLFAGEVRKRLGPTVSGVGLHITSSTLRVSVKAR